jgi:hypothetical protein
VFAELVPIAQAKQRAKDDVQYWGGDPRPWRKDNNDPITVPAVVEREEARKAEAEAEDNAAGWDAEALRGGTLEAHLTLATHFRTQSELVFCGQGTLAMALSALVPPERGARWHEGSLLDCCRPREEVLTRGISLGTFACLARCCGVAAEATRAPPLPAVGPGTRAAASTTVKPCGRGPGSWTGDTGRRVSGIESA